MLLTIHPHVIVPAMVQLNCSVGFSYIVVIGHQALQSNESDEIKSKGSNIATDANCFLTCIAMAVKQRRVAEDDQIIYESTKTSLLGTYVPPTNPPYPADPHPLCKLYPSLKSPFLTMLMASCSTSGL